MRQQREVGLRVVCSSSLMCVCVSVEWLWVVFGLLRPFLETQGTCHSCRNVSLTGSALSLSLSAGLGSHGSVCVSGAGIGQWSGQVWLHSSPLGRQWWA